MYLNASDQMTQPEVLAPRAKINSSVLVIVAGGTWLMKGVVLNCEVQIVLFVERDKRDRVRMVAPSLHEMASVRGKLREDIAMRD